MNTRELSRARKQFNERYAIDYPMPQIEKADDDKKPSILLWAWGIVSIAGAIISLPHTVSAVAESVNTGNDLLALGYAFAVFVGVELALLIVAFSEAYRELENPRPKSIITLKSILQSILYRLGIAPKPQPDSTDDIGNMKGLMLALVAAALLFNLADTTGSKELKDVTKIASGILAPMLLFLAGHEFAREIANRLLSKQVAQRRADEAKAEWQAVRDEAWRSHSQTPKEVAQEIPLVNTVPNSSKEWNGGDRADHASGLMNGHANGNGKDVGYLLTSK